MKVSGVTTTVHVIDVVGAIRTKSKLASASLSTSSSRSGNAPGSTTKACYKASYDFVGSVAHSIL